MTAPLAFAAVGLVALAGAGLALLRYEAWLDRRALRNHLRDRANSGVLLDRTEEDYRGWPKGMVL